jgi:hypothetical protein
MLAATDHTAAVTAANQAVEALRGADTAAVRAVLAALAADWQAAQAELAAMPRQPKARLGEENTAELEQWEALYRAPRLALLQRQEVAQVQFEIIMHRTNYQLRTDFSEPATIATFAA